MKSLLKKFKYLGAFIGPFLFTQFTFAQFEDNYKAMQTLQAEMVKTIEDAKSCVPKKDQLCAGTKFTPQKLNEFYKADLNACKEAIQYKNFKIISEKEIGNRYPHFIQSTNRALTLFDEKLVLYKTKEFNRIDCLHELLHIYQHEPTDQNLAPAVRKSIELKFLKHLNLAIVSVENIEKSGDVKKAAAHGQMLQPLIQFIKEWIAMQDWLDEKDIHYFIYQQCSEFKCSELDVDIALSNLYKLISYFPEDVAKIIKSDAANLIAQKEASAIMAVNRIWKPTDFKKIEISRLLQLSWKELLKTIKDQKIEISRVNSHVRIKELAQVTIPESIFMTLPEISSDLLKNSKIQNGDAFAKFFPTAEKNYILLTPISTRTSLVHEYLHYIQFNASPDYAKALLNGQKLMPMFLSGKMTRKAYEEETTKSNALFWMAEYEVYKTLIGHKEHISTLENLNNHELLEFYTRKIGKDK